MQRLRNLRTSVKKTAKQLSITIKAFDKTMKDKGTQRDADHEAFTNAPAQDRAQARQRYLETLDSQLKE